MAAVTQVADLPADVVGLLDVYGQALAVVDPRPHLGLPPQTAQPEQHLLLLRGSGRFLLWVDHVDAIVSVDATVHLDGCDAESAVITRLDGQLVAVLSAALFDPGQLDTATRARP